MVYLIRGSSGLVKIGHDQSQVDCHSQCHWYCSLHHHDELLALVLVLLVLHALRRIIDVVSVATVVHKQLPTKFDDAELALHILDASDELLLDDDTALLEYALPLRNVVADYVLLPIHKLAIAANGVSDEMGLFEVTISSFIKRFVAVITHFAAFEQLP